MKRALERHEEGDARVVPIILRACVWQNGPLGELQALPTDGEPVTSWPNKDEAFANVVRGIRDLVHELAWPERQQNRGDSRPSGQQMTTVEERVEQTGTRLPSHRRVRGRTALENLSQLRADGVALQNLGWRPATAPAFQQEWDEQVARWVEQVEDNMRFIHPAHPINWRTLGLVPQHEFADNISPEMQKGLNQLMFRLRKLEQYIIDHS